MASRHDPTLYEQVVQVTHLYLGPAADRFIARQVESHLHKTPNKLNETDLLGLIAWIRLAVSLLTDDNALVEEYARQLEQLASHQQKSK